MQPETEPKSSATYMSFRVTATGDGTQIVSNTIAGISLSGSYQIIAQNTIPKGTTEFLISCVGSYNTIISNRVAGSVGGIYTNGSHNIFHGNSVTAESGISAGVEVNGNENILYSNNISNFVCIGSTYAPGSSSNIVCGNTIENNLIIVGNSNIFNANYFQGIVMGNRIQDASNNIFYPCTYKRKSFEHERELRAVITKDVRILLEHPSGKPEKSLNPLEFSKWIRSSN